MRFFIAVVVFSCFILLPYSSIPMVNQLRPVVYVSFPTNIPAKRLKTMIQDKCSEVEINVFSRIRDFNRRITMKPADAIIILNPFSDIPNYTPFLQGLKNNSSYEKYVLITQDKKIDTNDLKNKKIGYVDFHGKNLTPNFLGDLLGQDITSIPLKTNSDIKSVLLFQQVDAIFASIRTYEQLKDKTKTKLVANEIDIRMKLISVSVYPSSNKEKIGRCVKNFDGIINAYMGVDQWK
jgi:hypothetical protein